MFPSFRGKEKKIHHFISDITESRFIPHLSFLIFLNCVDVLSSEMGKHKENVCSPNGVFEDFFRSEGSESESNSSRATTSGSEAQQNHKGALGLRGLVQLLRAKSTRHLPTMHPLSVLKLSVRSNSMRENPAAAPDIPFPGDDSGNFKNFTLSELQNATKNFSHEYVIGKGGYAEVYKGFLQDGQLIAIKRLTRGTTDERIRDFLSEFGIMAHVDHPNTTRLIGYGVEGGMHLILEFSPNGSLASLLHGSKEKLGWPIRYRIALGAARGLHYLHEGCHRRIIHRDIKAANILLTEDYEPQICDFGLAKWLPEQWTHQTISKFEGTFGYLAPEFLTHGIVDEKTDVFSFGVLLLELITGRRALDYSQKSLVVWAKPLLRKKKTRELVDPSLGEEYDSQQLNLVIFAAYLCVRQSSIRRPRMSQVVQLLKGDIGVMEGTKKSRKSLLQKGAEENKLTKKLHILNRHKQIALEF